MARAQLLQFIYTLEPVRPEVVTDPNVWTEKDEQTFQRHWAYLSKATEEGIVILAGRAQDGQGPAICVFEAKSEAEARTFMENDPFVAEGFARARLHPFRVALQRKQKI
ncbi:hypothetical protein HY230_04845 [Candidatus Acetothermia bacterium]|nr:hypothetical protein [Candidatus Acetothermia bacterium]